MNTLKSNLDEIDWLILHELQENARLSYSEIGRRVNLSTPAVQERIRKLEESGVLEGYHAKVNYGKLGLPILSVTRLMNVPSKQKILELAETIKDTPEVIHAVQVMGQDEYILWIIASSVEHLEQILMRFTDNCQSVSSIVIKSLLNQRTINLQDFPYLAEEQDS